MPKGIKPSPNFHGKKGRSGRKSFPIEVAKIETIKKSWNILNDHLEEIDNVNVALPIALKDMREKMDLTTKGKSLNYDEGQRRKIAERIIARNQPDGGGGEEPLN